MRASNPILVLLCCMPVFLAACSKDGKPAPQSAQDVTADSETPAAKEPPPEPGEAKDIAFPPVTKVDLANGLQVNTIVANQLPVVYATLVIKSGAESDPSTLPGLSGLVAQMLKEGTSKRSSAALAEEIEFLGADLWTASDEENTYVGIRALAEQFDEAMSLLAEVAGAPAFKTSELKKLKKRELDRLALAEREPGYIARRTFYRELYGENHPYGTVDTNLEAVKKVSRQDMVKWHKQHFVGNNAFLVVVGDVDPAKVDSSARSAFGRWKAGKRAEPSYGQPPERHARRIVVVDRPGSVQSVIYIGNLAIARSDPEWIPSVVANQVLGGSAASRLFMDLREKRSLTYGAYSTIAERVAVGPFIAYASVRTEVTQEAVGAFMDHLNLIVKEQAESEELSNAKRYLSDSFPLQVDTPGKLAELLVQLRTFGLPDDYWDTYRQSIRATGSTEALQAAQSVIRPAEALVVIVGQAADFAESLQEYGRVTVVSSDGEVKAQFGAVDAQAPAVN
jgi:zinc protease